VTTAQQTHNNPGISVQHLSKNYGKKSILKDLSFEAQKGEITGFLGPNGAGKSTTIKIIAGLVSPASGSVTIDGINMKTDFDEGIQKLGIMFEAPSFYNYLTARKNLEILNQYQGYLHDDILEILDLVGLEASVSTKVGEFSQGMRQRLGIAQALLGKPEILILDEPTNALDPLGRKEVKDLIVALAKNEKMTIFVSSHLLGEMEQICTHAVIINQGRIIASKPVAECTQNNRITLEEYFLELINSGS
jgi:ABC-2 type transport system ATP-binding protein